MSGRTKRSENIWHNARIPVRTNKMAHDGNLNRSKTESTGREGLKSAGKSNGEEATLRKGSLPKSHVVTTLSYDVNKGKAIECAEKQNLSDEKTGKGNLAQTPAGKKLPTFPCECGCE